MYSIWNLWLWESYLANSKLLLYTVTTVTFVWLSGPKTPTYGLTANSSGLVDLIWVATRVL